MSVHIFNKCSEDRVPDKPQVFREAFRVLKPGGRLALSDIVTDGPLPQVVKDGLSAWAGCVAGALDVKEYIAGLQGAGFTKVELNPVYFDQELLDEYTKIAEGESCCGSGRKVLISDGTKYEVIELGEDIDLGDKPFREAIFSAKITAYKP